MTETDPTATDVAHAIRRRDCTSAEILEALLTRIDRFNPRLNAIVTLDRDRARRAARDADAAADRGEAAGALHGVPITVKDAFDTAGMRTVSGHPRFAHRVPAKDAIAVGRLRQAGAIILGKTNLPPLANGIQSDNRVFGRTGNPWNLARTPGGSSGGSAAAISARLSYLELGSDIGGSIRIPSHFCGVYGLKTTAGRIAGRGHIASVVPLQLPAGWEPLVRLASFGPLARSIADLRLALTVLADPSTPALDPPPARPLQALRLAWTDDVGDAPLDQTSRRVIADFADRLTRGAALVSRQPSGGFDVEDAWHAAGVCLGAVNTLFQPPATRLWRRFVSGPLGSRMGPSHPLTHGLSAGVSLRASVIDAALERRERITEQLEEFLGGWDAWICPVFPTAAFTHRPPGARLEVDCQPIAMLRANLLHNVVFNLTGHPAVVIPIGLSVDGLPIGVQLVGRRWEEMALLDVAEQCARATDGALRPPGY